MRRKGEESTLQKKNTQQLIFFNIISIGQSILLGQTKNNLQTKKF